MFILLHVMVVPNTKHTGSGVDVVRLLNKRIFKEIFEARILNLKDHANISI